MPNSPESLPQGDYAEREKQEKTEARSFIKQIKTALLANETAKEKIFKQMSNDQMMKKVLVEFGANEKTKNFVINQFFSKKQTGITLPQGEATYSINWSTSYPHMGEGIQITKYPNPINERYKTESITVNTWELTHLEYRKNGEKHKRGLDAKPGIESFLNAFLPTSSKSPIA